MKKLAILISVALAITSLSMSANARKPRVSCKSFSTQAQAQAWYEQRKRSGKKGWKSLDRDKDGEACECLKGGSAYGKSVCKRK